MVEALLPDRQAPAGRVVLTSNTAEIAQCLRTDEEVVDRDPEDSAPDVGVSGSGDVRAGVVAGMVARGAEATQAAQAAVRAGHLHGRAQ